MTERTIKYQDIDELEPAESNPKKHDIDKLRASVKHHGFVEPIVVDERTGRLVAGHGRTETLKAMRDAGQPAPDGIRVVDGAWLAPVLRGWASENDTQASAYLVASNRLVEAGGWDESALADLLNSISAEGYLEASGHDERTLEELMRRAEEVPLVSGEDGGSTKEIDAESYSPNCKCPRCGFEFENESP
jgi:hypothetical protein